MTDEIDNVLSSMNETLVTETPSKVETPKAETVEPVKSEPEGEDNQADEEAGREEGDDRLAPPRACAVAQAGVRGSMGRERPAPSTASHHAAVRSSSVSP